MPKLHGPSGLWWVGWPLKLGDHACGRALELGLGESVWTETVGIWVLGTSQEEVMEIRTQAQKGGEAGGGRGPGQMSL